MGTAGRRKECPAQSQQRKTRDLARIVAADVCWRTLWAFQHMPVWRKLIELQLFGDSVDLVGWCCKMRFRFAGWRIADKANAYLAYVHWNG
jgi:hypothetical protein